MSGWWLLFSRNWKHGFTVLIFGLPLIGLMSQCNALYAQKLTSEEQALPLEEQLSRLESAIGTERLRWQIGIFRRMEVPIETRLRYADEMLRGTYPPDKAPFILGSANLAKAVALFQKGEIEKSIEHWRLQKPWANRARRLS